MAASPAAAAPLVLPDRLTLAEARGAAQALAAQAAAQPAGAALVVEASALARFDSSALAVLMEVRRRAEAGGRTLRVAGAPPRLQALARLYGVAEVLGLAPAASSAAGDPGAQGAA